MVKNVKKGKEPWLDKEQKVVLSNILTGYSIAAGVSLFSYWGGKFAATPWDAGAIGLVLVVCVVSALILRKEKS